MIPSSPATLASLWLTFFLSTCCLALPQLYRRAYQYFPEMVADIGPINPWQVAREPIAYDQPEDYFENSQWSDMQALSNLMDAYDDPRWGRIVNQMPEEEFLEPEDDNNEEDVYAERELAELKRGGTEAQKAWRELAQTTSTQAPSTTTLKPVAPLVSTLTKAPVVARGQKEFPLLRPPNHLRVKPSAEPAIISAQLTSTERQKKPSPYDTLREYLSFEDALKKEAAKRRLEARHEQQKRSSGNSRRISKKSKKFVADEASLTGQLNNLKKSIA